ncbi:MULTISPECIES: hypothetical protein [unclassified Photobacterium]|uniref:hypothetical protein n=1 Tax=unclassified Photobacterium TaxID=2628852 RepID=UPI001F2C3138|nr:MULTISPECIES: hypothetical protein [unclassified Photobacterium]MDO6704701.1 hypothetical protein [Photobacterium sp. 1_MG-2023]UIP27350.1 hypothetical protein LN341_12055 [Photobacterium sp. TLY01]
MYKGHWYDVMGKKRTDLRAMTLDFESLQLALDEAMSVLPDTRLIVMNENLNWGLISIEGTKRMLICKLSTSD